VFAVSKKQWLQNPEKAYAGWPEKIQLEFTELIDANDPRTSIEHTYTIVGNSGSTLQLRKIKYREKFNNGTPDKETVLPVPSAAPVGL
jgi:hypothetical protein